MSSTKRQLFFASFGAFPTAFAWAAGETLYFAFMLSLGLPASTISWTWLISPILGLILHAPLGRSSDTCTSALGRRRPFFLAITIVGAAALVTVAFSPELGKFVNPLRAVWATSIIAFVGYGIVDLAHDLLLGPSRALVNDLVPNDRPELADVANSYYTLVSVVGALSALTISSIPWFHIKSVFVIAASLALICCIVVVVAVKEPVYKRGSSMIDITDDMEKDRLISPAASLNAEETEESQRGGVQLTVIEQLKSLPRKSYTLWVAVAMGWMVNCPTSYFFTSYIATSICRGVADGSPEQQDNFNRGLKIGSMCMAAHYIVGMGVTVCLPKINKKFGTRFVFFAGEMIMGMCMLPMIFIPNLESEALRIGCAGGLMAFAGIFYATHNENPFTIVENDKENDISHSNRGFIVALLTLSLTIMQMNTPIMGQVIDKIGHGKIEYGFVIPAGLLLTVDTILILTESYWNYSRRK